MSLIPHMAMWTINRLVNSAAFSWPWADPVVPVMTAMVVGGIQPEPGHPQAPTAYPPEGQIPSHCPGNPKPKMINMADKHWDFRGVPIHLGLPS